MPYYEYKFDDHIVGTFELPREDYALLLEATTLLRDELELWNRRAIEHGADRAPYQQEVADLKRYIDWGRQALGRSVVEVSVPGISVGGLRYAKAALMLMVHKREGEYAEKEKERWPGAVLARLSQGIERVRRIASLINYDPSDVLWELIPRERNVEENVSAREIQWDVFVSHASEDSDAFARPLAEALRSRGMKVWFDEFTLTVGDSLRRSIDRGLAHSRFGVVVISPHFLRKEWTQKELDGLFAREVNGVKVILPVWHGVSREEVADYSPTLADRKAVFSESGLDNVVEELIRAIQPSASSGVAAGPMVRSKPITDRWVNSDYPERLGLNAKLRAEGYDLKWERAIDEATAIDIDHWEHVLIEDPGGNLIRLKVRDHPVVGGYVVLLKRKKAT